MNIFKVGDQVKLPEKEYPRVPGVVIQIDEKRGVYLVRFNGTQQLYFSPDELQPWQS